MKLVTQKCHRSKYDWQGVYYGFIRRRWLSRMFEIPKDARVIWFSIHIRAAKHRVAVRVRGSAWDHSVTINTSSGSSAVFISNRSLDKRLTPYVGKTVHLECWYE